MHMPNMHRYTALAALTIGLIYAFPEQNDLSLAEQNGLSCPSAPQPISKRDHTGDVDWILVDTSYRARSKNLVKVMVNHVTLNVLVDINLDNTWFFSTLIPREERLQNRNYYSVKPERRVRSFSFNYWPFMPIEGHVYSDMIRIQESGQSHEPVSVTAPDVAIHAVKEAWSFKGGWYMYGPSRHFPNRFMRPDNFSYDGALGLKHHCWSMAGYQTRPGRITQHLGLLNIAFMHQSSGYMHFSKFSIENSESSKFEWVKVHGTKGEWDFVGAYCTWGSRPRRGSNDFGPHERLNFITLSTTDRRLSLPKVLLDQYFKLLDHLLLPEGRYAISCLKKPPDLNFYIEGKRFKLPGKFLVLEQMRPGICQIALQVSKGDNATLAVPFLEAVGVRLDATKCPAKMGFRQQDVYDASMARQDVRPNLKLSWWDKWRRRPEVEAPEVVDT